MRNLFYIGITFYLSLFGLSAFSQKDIGRWEQIKKEVLMHYSQKDSLQLRAAHFLLENIPYHYSKDSKLLNTYYDRIDEI